MLNSDSLVCLYKFWKKRLFLGGNAISWGHKGESTGGAFAAPPSLYVKKAMDFVCAFINKLV
jgi:hypothetical protein